MAGKKKQQQVPPPEPKIIRRVSYVPVQKLMAGVALLCFIVTAISGVMAEVGVVTVAFRASVVILVIGMIGRLVVRILATYEEMSSGKS